MHRPAILYALASAALFGVTTPAAKILLGAIDPIVLAGLLYCGSGIGVALLRRIARGTLQESDAPQVALSRKDVPWLAGAITAGGIAGPLLLMFGLAQTDAATASLLLALAGAATALIAWSVFHENFDRRIALGMVCIVAGAIILAWSGKPTLQNVTGPITNREILVHLARNLCRISGCWRRGRSRNVAHPIFGTNPVFLRN